MTLTKKKAVIRKFMKEMTPYLISSALMIPDDATEEDIKLFVASKFVPYTEAKAQNPRRRRY